MEVATLAQGPRLEGGALGEEEADLPGPSCGRCSPWQTSAWLLLEEGLESLLHHRMEEA